MLKHNLLIKSGSIGIDMVENRPVCRLADKDASRLPEIVRLTITLFDVSYIWILGCSEPWCKVDKNVSELCDSYIIDTRVESGEVLLFYPLLRAHFEFTLKRALECTLEQKI